MEMTRFRDVLVNIIKGGDIMKRVMMFLVILFVSSSACFAALVSTPETFDGGLNGWVAYDMINERNSSSLTLESGELKLRYRQQSRPNPPEEHVVRADGNASAGRFTGDYIKGGVTAFSFRIKPESDAKLTVLFQNDAARRRWRYELPVLPQGVWSTVVVSVDPAKLEAVHSGGSSDQLIEDLKNVSWIGVLAVRDSSMAEQVTWLDDFRMVGPGEEFAVWMEEAIGDSGWQVEMLPDADFDGDGMINSDEFVAGTGVADRDDVFSIEISGSGESGVPLRWKSKSGRVYEVLRALQVDGDYETIHVGMLASPPENSYTDLTATGKGPWFYKIKVSRE